MKIIDVLAKSKRRAAMSLAAILGLAVGIFNTGQTNAIGVTDSAVFGGVSPVEGRTIRVVSTTADPGGTVTVSIELDSQGDEVATSFTLNFDPTIFSLPAVRLGTGAPQGASLSINANQSMNGRLGVLVDAVSNFQIAPPARQVIAVSFNVAADAPGGASPITFVTTPTLLSVSNPIGALLSTAYEGGNVTISGPASTLVTVGGRVTTPSGLSLRNAIVTLTDSNNVTRTATTSSFGSYSFSGVETGRSYTITASSRRFRFAPRVAIITDNVSNLDFAGLE